MNDLMADLDDMIAAKSRASWDGCAGCGRDTNTVQAAKDEIERLLSEVEIYENALRKIIELCEAAPPQDHYANVEATAWAIGRAREALEHGA